MNSVLIYAMQPGSLIEWAGAIGSILAGVGSLAAAVAAFYAARVALGLARDAHKAKLESVCKINFHGQMEFVIENIGPIDVVIHHIRLYVGRKGQERWKILDSVKETEEPPKQFSLSETFISVDGVVAADQHYDLAVSKRRKLFASLHFDDQSRDRLKKLIPSKKEIKTLRFMVCTNCGKFPVNSEKSVRKKIACAALQSLQ